MGRWFAAAALALAGCITVHAPRATPAAPPREHHDSHADRDGDGVPDLADRCADEPEDVDGFEDSDGCFDGDNDRDDVVDLADQCANVAEDRDGFQDDDGCPDPDNDGDSVPDVRDRCPNRAEVLDGVDDEDGCPDEGSLAVSSDASCTSRPEWLQIVFAPGTTELISGAARIEYVAQTLRRSTTIEQVAIIAHTRSGETHVDRLARARARAVIAMLVAAGMDATVLVPIAAGPRHWRDCGVRSADRAACVTIVVTRDNGREQYRWSDRDGVVELDEHGRISRTHVPDWRMVCM